MAFIAWSNEDWTHVSLLVSTPAILLYCQAEKAHNEHARVLLGGYQANTERFVNEAVPTAHAVRHGVDRPSQYWSALITLPVSC